MLDELFTSLRGQTRCQQSWLRGPIAGFLSHLAAQRYNPSTLHLRACRLLAFGEFTAAQGVNNIASLPEWLDSFVRQVPAQESHRGKLRRSLLQFIRHLQQTNVISAPASPPPPPHSALVEEYLRVLREQRGLCSDSLEVMRFPCQALLTFASAQGTADLRSLSPEIIHRFIAFQGQRCNRRTLRSRCSTLRRFLSYLHRCGAVPVDLAGAVVAPRVYQHEQCPRYLTRAEVDAVLAVVDRRTLLGRRNYAMLLLLAVYGLRGIEVVRLRLDDIDWRSKLLHVRRRKAGNSTTYPLSVAAGDAIVAYLQDGRPASTHREVFLTVQAPFTPFASSEGLATQVKKYLAKVEVHVARPGTHSFRYSCAQRLFETGTPLKTIGDYLGHTHPDSTQHYTKIAIEQLREVALDGEDLL